jgi:hypothetical protein
MSQRQFCLDFVASGGNNRHGVFTVLPAIRDRLGQIVREGGFPLKRIRMLFPQSEMAEDAFHDIGLINSRKLPGPSACISE